MLSKPLDIIRFLLRQPAPIARGILFTRHFDAAIRWIQTAFEMGDGGISKGYDLLRRKWYPAYPETTGYTIPSLLNAAEARSRPDLEKLALHLADYLLKCATSEGGVVHWQARNTAKPVVFDTGQVVFGWLAAYDLTHQPKYLQAAQRAGDWLLTLQDKTGAWKQNQHLDVVKVIDTRVAWALLELDKRQAGNHFRDAAILNLDWALTQQQPDGWFEHCAFTLTQDPFTHTLVYTAEGLLECGLILDEKKYLLAAQKTADALLSSQTPAGSLASTYSVGWKATARSSCLTGNCQAARLWLQYYENLAKPKYLDAAVRAIQYVAATQWIHPSNRNISGGIAGSYPLTGRYERLKYPNWAAKFFLDALLTLEQIDQKSTAVLVYKG